MTLQYYATSQEKHKEAYEEIVPIGEIELFYKKLQSHYKFRQVLQFRKMRVLGQCSPSRIILNREKLTIGTLAHEVAHAIQFQKRGVNPDYIKRKWHSSWHAGIMARVLAYINAHKEQWLEQDRQASLKAYKQSVARQIRQEAKIAMQNTPAYKLEQAQLKEKKLLTKLKRIQTALKKARRRVAYFERQVVKESLPKPERAEIAHPTLPQGVLA